MWIELPPIGTQKAFKKETPVYEVIRSFLLKKGQEQLKVERAFIPFSGELLRIHYNSQKYLEKLMIHKGKITHASTKSVEKRVDLPPFNLSEPEFFYRLQEFFSQSKTIINPPTYHNIKRLEPELRILPWQDDLSAIYQGSGIFIE